MLCLHFAQNEFIAEDVEVIVKNVRDDGAADQYLALQSTLGDSQFVPSKVDSWTNQIIDQCLKALQAQEKPFKYAVSVILQQKVGAGLHMAAAAHWDTKRDGLCELTLDNGHIECICTVYGVALSPSPQEA